MSSESDLLKQIQRLLAELRSEKRRLHNRHVGVGDLLTDRFDLAREYGFGEGTSCYDSVLILGDVRVGRNCWIGPNVILDASGGLSIGDHVDIGAGVQIYSHDTVRRVLSGGIDPIDYARTTIGSRVYVGPQTVIRKGVTIGSGVVIGAMSFVNADIPDGARVFGIPARPAP
jgi:acetyltransferase-like isoleucine patch superfamily enzyme